MIIQEDVPIFVLPNEYDGYDIVYPDNNIYMYRNTFWIDNDGDLYWHYKYDLFTSDIEAVVKHGEFKYKYRHI